MIRISEVKLDIDDGIEKLLPIISKKLKISKSEIIEYKIFKESIDARKKGKINFVYTVDVSVENEKAVLKKNKGLITTPNIKYIYPKPGDKLLENRPVIIGMGPAGLFAGLILAQMGYKPIILERGESVDDRARSVEKFFNTGKLCSESNIQFGEGGAGTFSDGKLTTRTKDLRSRKVLEELVIAGAPEEIIYSFKPHVGTDILKKVIKNIRKKIIKLGGEIRFNTCVSDFIIENNRIKKIVVNKDEIIEVDVVVLAIGHSARDTFEKIFERGVDITSKSFAIGVRIEHPQELINKAQYKDYAGHNRLGPAEYRLTYKSKNGRSVYTFCMCPGGSVVAAASETGGIITNGMSEHARDKENANSALLVAVGIDDFEDSHPLAGMYFQRKWEQKAFVLGGCDYRAPAQLVGDFLEGKPSNKLGTVAPSYKPGIKLTSLDDCLPSYVVDSMKEAITHWHKKLKGFAMKDTIITGVETRSSSPIRIVRDSDTLESTNVKGLYPSGEGAGYAGGIISAAIDGIKVAEKIILNRQKIDDVTKKVVSKKQEA
ncbi:MAG: NAD(P)/FAD-dependent oxidoreductase [Alkaliphilus sp.]